MRPRAVLAAASLVGAAVLTACITAPEPRRPAAQAYVETGTIRALAADLLAPPVAGSPADLADREVSDALKRWEDTDRWLLAGAQAELRPPLALQHFDCALGVRTADAEVPALKRLAERVMRDAVTLAEAADRFQRARPVADDPQRRACIRLDPATRARSAWPARPALYGAAYAEALALAAPERAEAVRTIGRAIGDSAAVCALNRPADVAAGAALGLALGAEQAQVADYRADAAAAGAEIAALRASGRTHPGCAAERRALAQPLTGGGQ